MQVVLLAGGFGTRLSEETNLIPKPLVEINQKPLIIHVMEIFLKQGYNEFIVCSGYKSSKLKEFFLNYSHTQNDIEIDNKKRKIKIIKNNTPNWKIKIIDTGLSSNTGERIKKIKKFIKGRFFLTYSDGVSNVDLKKLLKYHQKQKKIATVTTVNPTGRFGHLEIKKGKVIRFAEKQDNVNSFINAGFFVLEKNFFKYLENLENPILEKKPLENLAKQSQLSAYHHQGWWYAVDSLRDKTNLEKFLNEKR